MAPDEPRRTVLGGLAADHYGDAGDSLPPLVLLHGLGGSRRHWTPVAQELASIQPGRRVLALDLPGHGDTPPRSAYRLDDVTDAVHQAVAEAGWDAPVVVGHSMGGVLATVYAARREAGGVVNVDQPLLVGPFRDFLLSSEPVLRGPDYLQVWDTLLAQMGTDLLPPGGRRILAEDPAPGRDLLLGYWSELLERPAEDLAGDRTRDLAAIRAKAVGYRHVSVEPLPAGYREWLESALPDVVLTVLAGGGHFPHLAHPAEFAAILADLAPFGR